MAQPEVIYAHARNLTSSFLLLCSKCPQTLVYRQNVCVLSEIGVTESISGDKFAPGSRINVLAAHVQTLSSQMSPKMMSHARNDHILIEKRVHQILKPGSSNSSKLRMRSEKSLKWPKSSVEG